MTTFLIVRHGESMANNGNRFAGCRSDVALLERGLRQAELTAQYVAENYTLSRVYTSNLQRAYVTGKCIADRCGVEVTVWDELREIDGGLWEGVSFEDMAALYPEEFNLWVTDYGHSRCPGGESVAEVSRRIQAALVKIAAECPDQTVLITTHGSPVRVMQSIAQTGGLDDMNRIPWASNASVTVVTYDGQWHDVLYSYDAHLGDLKTELPKTV